MNTESPAVSLRPFDGIAGNFVSNIRALRVFSERIGRHADEHDKEVITGLLSGLERAIPGGFRGAGRSTTDGVVDEPTRQSDAAGDDPSAHDEAARVEALSAKMREPGVAEAVVKTLSSFAKRSPSQGKLLRQSALVTLMSYFEALVADLAHAYYARFPNALAADQRTLTLAELREVGSIEDAVTHLISQEVDGLLRESLDRQIAYFAKPLRVDTAPLDAALPELIEIDQRRNLFVHNRGVVNRHYLKRVTPGLAERFKAKDGEVLGVTDTYLAHAIDMVLVSGLILAIEGWAKWDKREHADRDALLVETSFEALQEGRYDVVCRIAEYGVTGPVQSDVHRRILTVNHACALGSRDDTNAMDTVIASHDWSAAAMRFGLAISSLTRNEGEFFRLLPKALLSDEVTREALEEWPVYARARSFPGFAVAVERLAPAAPPPDTRDTAEEPPAPDQRSHPDA